VEVIEESAERVRFRFGADEIAVDADGVKVTTAPAARIWFPLLISDGRDETAVTMANGALQLVLAGRGVRVEIEEPVDAHWVRTGERLRHHNGLVEPVYADIPTGRAVYRIRVPLL
jgi:hypothetical protein